MPKLRLLGAAIAALCCTPIFAGDFSNAVFFGDSLSDAGSFAPLLPPGTGRFTTNPGPVWAEVLGDTLGFRITPANQGGTDHAEGGARVSQLPGFPAAIPTGSATPVLTQLANHLGSRAGAADPAALYAFWAGGNDIFTVAGSAASDPAGTQAYLQTTAGELAGAVAQLAAAGARHIVVLNLPDVGASPFGRSLGAAGAAGLTQLTAGYNQLLGLGLAGAGVPVIQLDSFSLLHEIQADPGRYGFADATNPACGTTPSLLCTSADLVVPGADQSFLFADGVHPSTAGHAVLAEFVGSVLAAPAEISQLAEVQLRSQIALSRRLAHSAELALSTAAPDGNGAWANLEGGRTELDGDEGTPWGLAVGADRRIGSETVVGVALSFERSEPDWDAGGGFTAEESAVSAYLGWRRGALSLTGSLTLAGTDYDVDRRVRLGAATRALEGDTDGNRSALAMQLGYSFAAGALHHGPLLGMLVQDVAVKGYSERSNDGSTSTTLTYRKQHRRSTLLSAGWQAFLRAGAWTPYASLILNHDVEGADRQIELATSLSPEFVRLPGARTDASYATGNLGVVGRVGGGMLVSLELDAVLGSDALDDTRLSAGLRVPF